MAPASQWEGTPRALIAVVVALLVFFLAAYRYGIPLVARFVANRLPPAVTVRVTDAVLGALDGQFLRPTGVSADRQRDLIAAFMRLQKHRRVDGYRVLFRRSPELGANAVALPSGVIIVTDALVEVARDDREILGVLAHEAGHVEHQHGMRLVLQNSALTLFIGWTVGDFSSIIALAPTALLQAKYSRDLEREADAYAAELLTAGGISPAVLADMLERIEAWEENSGNADRSGQADRADGFRDHGLFDYAATHPATRERLDYLRRR